MLGSGMSEDQSPRDPITLEYNTAMQEFTNLPYTTSAHHKDLKEARIKRQEDQFKTCQCSPFLSDPSLRNTFNGVVAQKGVDMHEYESVGCKIMHKMIGQSVFLHCHSTEMTK